MTESICEEATRIVGGDRRQDYGGVRGSFDRIAQGWSGILGAPVTGEQVALCMLFLKVIRESHANKRDNRVDMIGYTLCLDQMLAEGGHDGADFGAMPDVQA